MMTDTRRACVMLPMGGAAKMDYSITAKLTLAMPGKDESAATSDRIRKRRVSD